MATIDQIPPQVGKAGSFLSGIRNILTSIGNAIVEAQYARARVVQMEVLYAKTDFQLAEMGLKREDIPRYVYRDKLYL